MGGSSGKSEAPAPTSSSSTGSAPAANRRGTQVSLNVYSPSGGQHAVYHSGLEVGGTEYVFGGGDTNYSGVTLQRPRVAPAGSEWVFYQNVPIGTCTLSNEDITRAIVQIKSEFPASGYDLLSRNCNHFSDALARRLCGQGIPAWVNRMAGLGASVRGVIGSGSTQAAPQAVASADQGAGGLASAGLVKASVTEDGELRQFVKWSGVGVDNAKGSDSSQALQNGDPVYSDDGSTGELLVFFPMESPVKLQELRLQAPSNGAAPTRVRLFANKNSLDMNDAAGGEAATQEFTNPTWVATAGGVVSTTLKVNFLKFQNLGHLAVYFGRTEDEDENETVAVAAVKLIGKS